jgi:UDP-perosamine 4-acetyltransferase
MNIKSCILLGGGGHARVLLEILLQMGAPPVHGILDSDASRWGQALHGVPILGGDDLLGNLPQRGVGYFAVSLGATGDYQPRRRLFEMARSVGLEPVTIVSPQASCSRWATLGAGAQLLPLSIVNAGAQIGINAIINSGAIVEHDCVLGDHVHVASGATLASTIRVGVGAHIGAGATVRQGVSIGEGAIVGAGAVVVDDIAPWSCVVGVPARPMVRQTR